MVAKLTERLSVSRIRKIHVLDDGFGAGIELETEVGLMMWITTPVELADLYKKVERFQNAASAARMVARDRDTPGWRNYQPAKPIK